ncbi:MAG: alpha/beta fold hydrolase [Cyanobacteria bacterium J06623_4]
MVEGLVLLRFVRVLLRVGTVLLLAYALICLALWRYQPRLMFFPAAELRGSPADLGLAYEEVWLPAGDGKVHGWWMPAADTAAPAVLYLHGNGSNIGDLAERALLLHRLGCSVLLIDYRGYGLSSGPFPNEQRVYEDAKAAWQYLRQVQQVPGERLILYGRSIGGAIAIQLASEHPEAAGLVVEATFTSMRAMVQQDSQWLWLPVDRLLTQRFESLEKVRSLQMPLLLMHGTADRVVPAEMSQALYDAAATEDKTLLWVEGADHNNLPLVAGDRYSQAVGAFIERYAR